MEEREKISQEVQELVTKGEVVETTLSKKSFVSQIFLVEKKEGGQRPVINLKSLNTFVRTEHFKMEGLHILPDLIQAQDDRNGSEGCLPSGSNPQETPAPPAVSMEWEDILVPVSAIWVNLSTTGFFEGDKAGSGNAEVHGHSADHIPGRYLGITPGERRINSNHGTNLPHARSSGSGDQPEKVSANPSTNNGILGIPSGCNNIALDIPS